MDPTMLVVGALAAGAVKGVGESAAAAVQDAYSELKQLVRSRLGGRVEAEAALERHAADPESGEAGLARFLAQAAVAEDATIVAAAVRLIGLVDASRPVSAKYQVDVRNAQGVQVGDGIMQVNTFGANDNGR